MTLRSLAGALALQAAVLVAAPSVAAEAPEALVQRQVEAYNAGDVQAFANTYADDVELFELGADSKPFLRGRAALIAEYGPMFAKAKPKATILHRTVSGAFVTDHERVTAGPRTVESVAVYQVESDKIRRVWFTP
ncbi:MAG: nuclear transport factor 2 family protein [Alphaproteobacteria bacterium]|nr:nuclear transport factor 2 family protein [Alphaproteobacteria bacterium]MBU1515905.1 nuclear transport factor 2 family protein [Alphaproteobacteria bacterium]MBU2094127.1 nuclear transport factor 2 family protein [Alphaproteobacteria bacterium]MBU2151479.1 nuclear transport factor 2 family protein [Alphaproteobacteria bacterium]MBU2305245.1 nuclear transport factor 2 family protein [Alphaproteobacteria bacterium]